VAWLRWGAWLGVQQRKGRDVLKSRAWRLSWWALLALLLLWALAWLALPPLLKWQLETRGSQLLGRELRVTELRFAPITLALTLRGLSIGAAPGSPDAQPQLQVERLFIDIDARSLLRLAPVVDAIEIDAPRLRLARLAEGHYDIDDVLQRLRTPPPQPPAEPARFALFNLRLAGGEISLDDRLVGRKHEVRKLTLDLPFLSNLSDHLQVKVEPRLAFELDGSAFESRGQSTPFAQGRPSEFKLRFDKLELDPWWAYLPRNLPLQPSGGALWADLSLRFEQHQQTGPRVELHGQIDVRDMALKAGEAPVLAWQSLRIRLADVRPLQRQAKLDALHLDGAVVHVRRDASGNLELARLAMPPDRAAAPAPTAASAPATASSAAASASSAPATAASAAATAASAAATAAGGPAAAAWTVQLALLELNGAQVRWLDAAVQPQAELQLDAIDLRLKQLRWPVEADASLQLDAQLLAAGKAAGRLHAEGTLTDRQAKITASLNEIDLAAAEPYLRQQLRPQASARLSANGELDWARGEAPRLALVLSSFRVDDLLLSEAASPAAKAPRRAAAARSVLLQVPLLELADLRADVLQRSVAIGSLSIQRPFIELARDAGGVLNVSSWTLAGAQPNAAPAALTAADPAPPAAANDWRLELRQFKLEGGRARFSDAALQAGPLQLDNLRASAQGLAWPLAAGAAPLATQFSARLAQASAAAGGSASTPARLDWNGLIGLQPASARGKLLVERFPVHVFEPYVGDALPLLLQRLEAGFKGELDLRQLPAGLSGQVRGDALLADLRVLAKDSAGRAASAAPMDAGGRELLRWNEMNIGNFGVTLQPGSRPLLEIGELRISDYYSRLEITEEGRFNLQTVATPAGGSVAEAPAAAANAASAPTTASATQVSAPSAMLSRLPIDLVVASTVFSNGRVDFNDRFVRPNYSAELSELNGTVGRLDSRTRDLATLQFKGRVAGTGLLEIGGSINPTVSPPALDITAKATDIELPGLTPYAAKYAGYPIERGKLSVDVAYKIDADGKLEARNQIRINQLTFGAKTDSPDATKLPVLLAVALLQDRHGVIDLDLPITGSLNDPQFSLGALIWKVIVDLFTKAVTAPFSLLSGGGGGKDLSTVDFRSGTALIADNSQEVIAKVAKALDDRPALKLSITGMADASSERQAMQRAALEARLLDEQRREAARGALGKADADLALPPMTPQQRERLVKQLYTDTRLPDKPRNLVGMAKDLPQAEMEAMLAAAVPVDAAAARQLAVQRGRAVREALMAKGLGSERLFLGEPKLRPEGADNTAWTPQAQLTLSPN
jgi:hypothetical protein